MPEVVLPLEACTEGTLPRVCILSGSTERVVSERTTVACYEPAPLQDSVFRQFLASLPVFEEFVITDCRVGDLVLQLPVVEGLPDARRRLRRGLVVGFIALFSLSLLMASRILGEGIPPLLSIPCAAAGLGALGATALLKGAPGRCRVVAPGWIAIEVPHVNCAKALAAAYPPPPAEEAGGAGLAGSASLAMAILAGVPLVPVGASWALLGAGLAVACLGIGIGIRRSDRRGLRLAALGFVASCAGLVLMFVVHVLQRELAR